MAEEGDRSEALRNGWVLSGLQYCHYLSLSPDLRNFLSLSTVVKKRSSQSRALGPNCLISSVWMSSRPGALPFFSTLMPISSSSAVNVLVNPGSSGYRCRLRCTFGCLFGTLPISGVGVPLGSQWCCSAASACTGRHKDCVSWTTPSCCCGSCLLIRSGSAMLYGVPLRCRSSVPPRL